MHVACCQFDIAWEDRGVNFARVRGMLAAARLPPGTLVLLPEMFASGFSMNVAGIADDGETEAFLASCAADLGLHLLAGLVTRAADGRGLNQAVVVAPDVGGPVARYTKLHPFSFGQEMRHYARGDDLALFSLAAAPACPVCPLICYDLRFPEVFRQAALAGAKLFAVIANWPAAREDHWVTLLRARAIENQAYVAGVNRIGRDPGNAYAGRSMIIDPRGVVLADAGSGAGVIGAELELDALEEYRRSFPALADIHPAFLRPREG